MDALLNFLYNNWMLIAAGAAGGLLGLLFSYKPLGKIFRMVLTSTSEIGYLPMDAQVGIVGNADGGAVLESPITKKACVLWQVEVKELRQAGKSSHWVTVYHNRSAAPFDVYDPSGRVRVQPGNRVELLLKDDVKQSSGLFSSLDEQTQTILEGLGIKTKGTLKLNKRMRVYERYIEKGDQIFLLGKAMLQNGTKIIDGNVPLIVSDQGKIQLMIKFLTQVILNSLLGVALGAIIYLAYMDK